MIAQLTEYVSKKLGMVIGKNRPNSSEASLWLVGKNRVGTWTAVGRITTKTSHKTMRTHESPLL